MNPYSELLNAATEVALSGVVDIDPRMHYVEVQVDRDDWAAFCAAVEKVRMEP